MPGSDETIPTFNDIMMLGKFDNIYFKNLAKGLGLLASNQLLMLDPKTRPFEFRLELGLGQRYIRAGLKDKQAHD